MCNSPIVAAIGSCALALGAVAAAVYVVYRRRRRDRKLLADPQVNYPIKLIEKTVISPDTRVFRFALHSSDQRLGLPLGQHVYLSARIKGELVVRPYTPVSQIDALGYVTFVIKVYKRGEHPKFPEGGKMSQHLDSLALGDTVNIRGPSGLLEYEGQGCFAIKKTKTSPVTRRLVRKIAMIAGGSGITPMFQLMQAMLRDPEDQVEIWLVYANKTEEDILLRQHLDRMALEHGHRCKVWYTVERAGGRDWQYDVGFVNKEMLKAHLPSADDDVLALVCGPPAMVNMACKPNLQALSYDNGSVFIF